MNGTSLQKMENAGLHAGSVNPKRNCEMFFNVDLQKEISSFKNELFNQIKESLVALDNEFAEINRLVEEKIFERSLMSGFKENFSDYLPHLQFLFELTHILKRIQPYCDFLNEAVLPYMRMTVEKIRLASGCNLKHPNTWSIAHEHTHKICEDATRLEVSKLKLSRLFGYVYNDLEWFVLSFKAASWESKRDFFRELNKNEQLLAWTQPWIDIAEDKEGGWQQALITSMESLTAKELEVQKRMYE